MERCTCQFLWGTVGVIILCFLCGSFRYLCAACAAGLYHNTIEPPVNGVEHRFYCKKKFAACFLLYRDLISCGFISTFVVCRYVVHVFHSCRMHFSLLQGHKLRLAMRLADSGLLVKASEYVRSTQAEVNTLVITH